MIAEALLLKLPVFNGNYELVKKRQSVKDIRNALLQAHEEFESDYDRISLDFLGSSGEQTLMNIFDFLKQSIRYVEESVKEQTIKSPAALIETGEGDCKSLASFVGGVVDSLIRKGERFDFCYVFAGYGDTNHVFVEVGTEGNSFWVDPVLKQFNQRTPVPLTIKKFVKDMALYKVSGAPDRTGMIGSTAGLQTCVLPYESLDEQMVRLSKCSAGGEGILVPEMSTPDLYDLPFTGDLPTAAPIDAVPMDPGMPVTMTPSPPPGLDGGSDDPTGLPSPGTTTKAGNVMEWVKKNPIGAAGIAALLIFAIARKKKR